MVEKCFDEVSKKETAVVSITLFFTLDVTLNNKKI